MSLLDLYFGALGEASRALGRVSAATGDDPRAFAFLEAAGELADVRHALEGDVRLDADLSGLPVRSEIVRLMADAADPPKERDPTARSRMLDDILVRRRMPSQRNRLAAQRDAYVTRLAAIGDRLEPLQGPQRVEDDHLRWAWWEGSTNRPHVYDIRFDTSGGKAGEGIRRLSDEADPLVSISRAHIPAFALQSLAAKLDLAGGAAARPKTLVETTLRTFRVKAVFPNDPLLADAPEGGWYVEWTRKVLVSARTVEEPYGFFFKRPREAYALAEDGPAKLKGVTEYERHLLAPHEVLTSMSPAALTKARFARKTQVVLRDGAVHDF